MTKQTQLQQVQLGKETTFGTAVAQTIEVAGVRSFQITPTGEGTTLRHLGNYAAMGETINGVSGSATLEQDFNYQHAGLVFDSSLATATPTGSDPYVRAYTARTTTNPTRSFYTFGKGDANDMYSMAGAICAGWTLSAENASAVTLSSEWVASMVNTDTLDSVAPITAQFASSAQVTLKMAAVGGSLTAVDCDVNKAVVVYNDGTMIGHGLGAYAGCKYWPASEPTCTINLQIEADNSAIQAVVGGLLGASPASPKRDIELTITDGTSDNICVVGVCAYLPVDAQPEYYADADGRATFDVTLNAQYDANSNFTSFLDVELTNTIAAYFA